MHKQNYSVNQLELHALHLRSVIFFYLFIDYKHKQNDTATTACHVPHVHFFYLFIDYKHTATASELYVVHLLNAIFFYLFIDYKHKHTATGLGSYVLHPPPTPYIFNRLQAQARPRPGVKHHATEARTTVIFY